MGRILRPAGNQGRTRQRMRHRTGCQMAAYDALPAPLRAWLTQAALPWSPASTRALWLRAVRAGCSEAEACARLSAAEARALLREGLGGR